MKTKLFFTVAAIAAITTGSLQKATAQANKTLSNLMDTTAVNVNLLPRGTIKKDLGSSSHQWKDFYIGGDIYFGGTRLISNKGTDNLFAGSGAGNANTSGSENTVIGYAALGLNTTGSNNTATGYLALLYSNGSYNTANGSLSLQQNTTGSNNTASGSQSLFSNNNGNNNTASGWQSLYRNTSGSLNTATGGKALYLNTTGSYNTANGFYALNSNTEGLLNTAIGYEALFSNNTGFNNTAVGAASMFSNISGNANTAIGIDALDGNQLGSYNTAIGYDADVLYNNLTNATAIGSGAIVNASNKIRLGNGNVAVVEGNVYYTVSDVRFKKNIVEDVKGLSFINKLRPVVYNFQARKFDEFLMKNKSKEKRDSILKSLNYKESENLRRSGFIAQEVEKAAKESNYDFDGVYKPKNDNDNYSLSYAEFVVPLVKAVQELSAQNDSLKSRIDKIEQMLAVKQQTFASNTNTVVTFSSAQLYQNQPNPLTNSTSIRYNIPTGVKNAQIVVTDFSGKPIKQVSLNSGDAGEINIDASALSNGTYTYSLIINGKKMISKKMMVAK